MDDQNKQPIQCVNCQQVTMADGKVAWVCEHCGTENQPAAAPTPPAETSAPSTPAEPAAPAAPAEVANAGQAAPASNMPPAGDTSQPTQ